MNEARSARAGELATQHRARLLRVARRLCRNTTDADDLVQETLLRFIRDFGDLETLPNERACESWMSSTLNNLFTDQCRRQRVQEKGATDPTMNRIAPSSTEPTAQPVYDTLTDEQVGQAMKSLSSKKRAVLELHASGKRYLDIARLLGITPGTARKRVHDARVKLRELLRHYLPPGDH